ncbi:Eco57I restriction-modification methylase domain-containing protein [Spirilliplanes yamanashiensis]|uniref:site-specific DNA-methyltransferase (adenine-specific) n=1 Tax=Spirilliplanes yamanashiensis TaxID=42233 RepID=A0A8J3Y6F4_9ACTN|nr:methyltransferase domain-containing protein [Spirilliplanes yamanashiensis]MDP9814647.1 SAM-dependent methyltransferase [Spirilliplanes yamanashiensis]GIJ02302.1 type II DNA modification methyltransferase [Spirilliplanes yamanashiensis]
MPTPPDRRKRHGVHYTPPPLAAFLASRAAAFAPPGRPLRVLDPACGDGELLAAAAAALGPGVRLTGYDRDPAAVAAARTRLPAADLRTADFLETPPPAAGFDLVITNPPYVRTQVLGAHRSAELSARLGLRGRVDLTHAFVALAGRALRPGGVLALLCANRFLFTRAGANMRHTLTAGYDVREVFDLGDTRLFDAAVLPAIVIATASAPATEPGPSRYVRAYQSATAAAGGDLYAALRAPASSTATVDGRTVDVTVGELAAAPDPAEPWRQRTPAGETWRARVAAGTWRRFGDLAKIRVGIKTTADAVFVRDNWDALPPAVRPEDDLLLPLLTHRNLTAWSPPTDPATRVLYPYDRSSDRRRLLDLAAYPRARSYLDLHADRLRSRRYVTDAGRAWYEIWVPQRPSSWRSPKVVFPDISVRGRFALDRSGAVVNGDCYWINVDELPSEDVALLMAGVANSSFGAAFYDRTCGNQLYAGRRRWITQYVERFPLPDPDSVAGRQVVAVARKLCEAGAGDQPDLLALLDEAVATAFDVA